MALDKEADGLSSVHMAYPHSPHLNIPRSFKIVIYLILEHIYISSINTFTWQSIPFIYRSLRNIVYMYVRLCTLVLLIDHQKKMSPCRENTEASLATAVFQLGIFMRALRPALTARIENKKNKKI